MGKRSSRAMTPTEIISGGGGGVITPHDILKSWQLCLPRYKSIIDYISTFSRLDEGLGYVL